jgi:hypothetical protein
VLFPRAYPFSASGSFHAMCENDMGACQVKTAKIDNHEASSQSATEGSSLGKWMGSDGWTVQQLDYYLW